MADSQNDPVKSPPTELDRMREALRQIRHAGNNFDETAIWMQKVAAHGMDPKWPHPGEQP